MIFANFWLGKNYFDLYLGFFYEKMIEIRQILIRIKKSGHGSTTHVPTSWIFFLGFCMFVCFLPTIPQIFSNIALRGAAQEGFCNK
jgi:hypothetical protein